MSKNITITQLLSSPLTQIKVYMGRLSLLSEQSEDTSSSLDMKLDAEQQTWEITSHRTSIGSLEGSDLFFPHPMVSRQHAYIEVDERGYRLVDTQSKNGVYINQTRIINAFLADGDVIQIGAIKLLFREIKETSKSLSLWAENTFGELYGQSIIMRELFALLHRISQSDINLLVEGESGTGKELAARAIHHYSDRVSHPFIVFDCSSVPPNLIESELFGHKKGSFTGATENRAGAFLGAHGGILFLDEIGELPLELQPKLLRALERNEVKPVGSDHYISVDVRVICATHRKLSEEVDKNRFRLDLFYRLAIMKVQMPALRDHRDDIPGLVDQLITQLSSERREVSYQTMSLLMQHEWRGNVRELKNYVQRALILSSPQQKKLDTKFIVPHQINPQNPTDVTKPDQQTQSDVSLNFSIQLDLTQNFKDVKSNLIDRFERVYWRALMDKYTNNISAAARIAGIHRKSAEYIIKKLGLRNGDKDV